MEILKNIKKVANRETASRNTLMETNAEDYKLLLDYITNLQQENERLNNAINEAIYYLEIDMEGTAEHKLKKLRGDKE